MARKIWLQERQKLGVRGKVGDTYLERSFNEDESFVERFPFFFFISSYSKTNEKKRINYTRVNCKMDRESCYNFSKI